MEVDCFYYSQRVNNTILLRFDNILFFTMLLKELQNILVEQTTNIMVCVGSILNFLLSFKNFLGILSCHNQVKNFNSLGWLEIGILLFKCAYLRIKIFFVITHN